MSAAENIQCICGVTAYPSLNMNERMQIVPACPSCGREHPGAVPLPPPANAPSALRLVRPPAVEEATADPVALIQKRIAFLDGELAKSAEYTQERRRLRRMLKAAGELS